MRLVEVLCQVVQHDRVSGCRSEVAGLRRLPGRAGHRAAGLLVAHHDVTTVTSVPRGTVRV